jgi:hypothetical protein
MPLGLLFRSFVFPKDLCVVTKEEFYWALQGACILHNFILIGEGKFSGYIKRDVPQHPPELNIFFLLVLA